MSNWKMAVSDKLDEWGVRRKVLIVTGLLLAGFLVYAWVVVYYPYSDGYRAGVIRKLSRKGFVFKTWEGELQLGGLQGYDPNQIINGGNVWQFSVKDDPKIIEQLEQAQARGQRVSLHYVEYLRQFGWRGDTKYFIDGLKTE